MFKEIHVSQIDDEVLEIKRILEALLFSCDEPISLTKFKEILHPNFTVTVRTIQSLLEEIQESYDKEQRALQIDRIGDGYIVRTVKEMRPFIEKLQHNKRSEKLSKASMEVLAIIAYKQPITRSEIEGIRGVDCSGTLSALTEKGLILIAGRKDVPGRPSLYEVSKHFLQHFGLNNIKDLL